MYISFSFNINPKTINKLFNKILVIYKPLHPFFENKKLIHTHSLFVPRIYEVESCHFWVHCSRTQICQVHSIGVAVVPSVFTLFHEWKHTEHGTVLFLFIKAFRCGRVNSRYGKLTPCPTLALVFLIVTYITNCNQITIRIRS